MKIRVFQSEKGDCLLLTSKDNKHMLADGGMARSYTKHVSPFLGKMRERNEEIDLVYVSHIDQDHISGILKMTDDAIAWKIHEFQVANGNPRHRKPKSHQPPELKSIWHNSFHEQLGKNAGPIEDMLAASAPALSLRSESWVKKEVGRFNNFVTSNREAALLSRRIGDKQLDIPLNPEFGGGLMFVVEPPDVIKIGAMTITVIGPFTEDLKKLRGQWNAWLRSTKGKRQVTRIKEKSKEDEDLLGNSEIDDLLGPLFAFSNELGDRNKVTAPNLASLMLLVEEDGKQILMTGDGHCDDVLDGLDVAGRLRADGGLHVEVLKMLHHGSEHNWHKEFGKKVTADHYIFCGDGAHHNPDEDVVQGVINSRMGSSAQKSKNPEVGHPFKLWFNSSSSVALGDKTHMKKLEQIAKKGVDTSSGQMKAFFLNSGSDFAVDL